METDIKSNWEMPCPKCGSLKKDEEGLGSVHGHGYNKFGLVSSYCFTCYDCGCNFSKEIDYGNKKITITVDGVETEYKMEDKKIKDENLIYDKYLKAKNIDQRKMEKEIFNKSKQR